MITLIICLVIGYLVGSIPTSILVGKLARGIDIRDYGSGNPGATNVYRVFGLKLALLVFIIDAGKAAATVLLVAHLKLEAMPFDISVVQVLTGLAVMAGNVWPVWIGFAGGKGVSTSTGVFLALAPLAAACTAVVWVAVVAMTRYVSLASICAALTLPLVLWLRHTLFQSRTPLALLLFTLLVPVIVLATHRSNIRRLLSGTENHLGSRAEKTGEK